MKNKNKKLLAALGAVSVAALGCGSAFAGQLTTSNGNNIVTNTGTLTVNNVGEGDKFQACKFVDMLYKDGQVSFQFNEAFQTWWNTKQPGQLLPSIEDYLEVPSGTYREESGGGLDFTSTKDIDRLAAALASDAEFTGNHCDKMTTNSTTATTTVAYGSYLVVPDLSAHAGHTVNNLYSAMIMTLTVKLENGDFVFDSENSHNTMNAKKVSVTDGITKNADKKSYSLGEEVNFTITSQIPKYPATAKNKYFVVSDYMGVGLKFQTTDVTIKVGNQDDKTYTLTEYNAAKCGIHGDAASHCIVEQAGDEPIGYLISRNQEYHFVFNDVSTLGNNDITITYKAKVTSSALIGKTAADAASKNIPSSVGANENIVQFRIPQDMYAELEQDGENWDYSTPKNATIYTYGLEIEKVEKGNTMTKLDGAEFKLYNGACNGNSQTTEISTIKQGGGTDKKYTHERLAAGTYCLKETKAPLGYKLPSAGNTIMIPEESENGTNSGTDTTNGTWDGNGFYKVQVENEKALFSLPFTGGKGVAIYAILGIAIVTAASVKYSQKSKTEKR